MKNKTKVVLGLAAMLAGTAGIAGVSTFAWFTTQNSAAISFQHAHVVSDSEAITVAYVAGSGEICGIADSMAKNTGTDLNPTGFNITGATVNVRDISGYADTFYRPKWNSVEDTGKTATSIDGPLTNSSANSFWVHFQMLVTNKGTKKTDVYLDAASTVSAMTGTGVNATASAKAANATRISVADGTTVTTIWQANTDTAYKTLRKATTTGAGVAYGLTNAACDLVDATTDAATKDVFHAGAWTTVGGTFTPDAGQKLCTLDEATGTTPSKTLTVCAWLDGTVTDATNEAIGGDVQWSLSIKGVNKAA